MKKVLLWIAGILLVLFIGIFAWGWLTSKPLPTGKTGPEAEALADKVLEAINFEAWDSTRYVSWDFAGRNQYVWNKEQNFVKVTWGENHVLLHTKTITGKAYTGGKEVTGAEGAEMIQTAWGYFCNDSFWLNAPAKVKDPGTERSIVKDKGKDALLISYKSGGVTPGDAYLWELDANGLPISYKMWVSIIPIGGMEVPWNEYQTLSTGALVSTVHPTAAFELVIGDLKGGMSLADVGLTSDPFAELIGK